MLPPLKIVLAQVNPTVGDIRGNGALLEQIMGQHASADLIIFPEGVLPGYPAQDLLLEAGFLADLESELRRLAGQTGKATVILGTVRQEDNQLYNTAAVLQNGAINTYRDKTLLPTYDVFDEARYFTAADSAEPLAITLPSGASLRLGLHICEDLWDEGYEQKVCDRLASAGIDLFVNISASPFRTGIHAERKMLIRAKAKRWQVPYFYCNLVGAQDELIFDGRSAIFDGAGNPLQVAAAFREDILALTLPEDFAHPQAEEEIDGPEALCRALTLGIGDYFHKTGHRQAVVGLSGGIDSSVVAVLAAWALGPKQVTGVIMPSVFNAPESAEDARLVARNLGLNLFEMPIESLRQEALHMLTPVLNGNDAGENDLGLAGENLQARLRGLLLMAVANRTGALLLTTGNKTELALGYATLYGDMAGALAPIGDLSKTDVYTVARHLNSQSGQPPIPQSVLEKPPSAELRPGQTDPFDYDLVAPLVEQIITGEIGAGGRLDDPEAAKYRHMIRRAEYKRRQAPPALRVTGKAFGSGRRYPIVNRYE